MAVWHLFDETSTETPVRAAADWEPGHLGLSGGRGRARPIGRRDCGAFGARHV